MVNYKRLLKWGWFIVRHLYPSYDLSLRDTFVRSSFSKFSYTSYQRCLLVPKMLTVSTLTLWSVLDTSVRPWHNNCSQKQPHCKHWDDACLGLAGSCMIPDPLPPCRWRGRGRILYSPFTTILLGWGLGCGGSWSLVHMAVIVLLRKHNIVNFK